VPNPRFPTTLQPTSIIIPMKSTFPHFYSWNSSFISQLSTIYHTFLPLLIISESRLLSLPITSSRWLTWLFDHWIFSRLSLVLAKRCLPPSPNHCCHKLCQQPLLPCPSIIQHSPSAVVWFTLIPVGLPVRLRSGQDSFLT
jgi:hypothetical protein